jgi:ankyrin repeat protein
MSDALPARPNLEHLKKQAKALLREFRAGDAEAIAKFRTLGSIAAGRAPKLADAHRLVARDYGFASWQKLKAHVAAAARTTGLGDGDPKELIKAAFQNDDAKQVRDLLRRRPELKALVNAPVFAFCSRAINNVRSRAMLDVLLEAGADINARSEWWAGSFGILDSAAPELAAYAVERGAVVDVHAAARLGMIDRLRELVTADPSLVHARGGDGQTPLHFASTIEIAQYLLDQEAQIDARDVDHESTPAQYMVRDRQAIARYLVDHGCRTDILMAAALGDLDRVRQFLDADPDAIRTSVSDAYFPKSNPHSGGTIYQWTLGFDKTPHVIAREFGHAEVFQLLMERSPEEVKLSQACELGDEETFRALRAAHPNLVRTLSDEDRRKLATAARNNNADAVRLMLAAGWPVDARGQHNGTALHWAAYHGNAAMTREILRYAPPLEDVDNDFHATPLGWATHGSEHGWYFRTGDYPATVELLCAAGAKIPRDELKGTVAVQDVLRKYAAT